MNHEPAQLFTRRFSQGYAGPAQPALNHVGAGLGLGLAITETFPSLPNAGFLEPTFALLFVGTELFLTVLVIQSDPAGREFRFLLTRPVPGAAIGVAKALFLTVFIVGPFWIAQEFELARVGVALSVSDHVLL